MIAQRTSVNCWTVVLEEDPTTGDLILPLSEEMLATTGWQLGDTVVWELSTSDNGPCAIISKKKEEPQNDDN
jgi:hypothetical protein